MIKNWSKRAQNNEFGVTIKMVTNGLHMVTNWVTLCVYEHIRNYAVLKNDFISWFL